MENNMLYAQIFQYALTLEPSEYVARFVEPYAENIADFPGLIRKTWMADYEQGKFASFYLWQSKEAMDHFMASPAIATVAAEPFLENLEIISLPVVEDASAITRGV